MPRLPPWLLRQAKRQSPNLAALLPACRDIPSARNELRWIEQHVHETTRRVSHKSRQVRELCQSRGRGVPLQYVLGSQPFGHLDIKCRPGVLIPRPETEAYTCHLIDLIKKGQISGLSPARGEREVNIVDFCTGTGCIPLLLFASLQRWATRLNVLGVDIADAALRLANDNVHHNEELGNLSVNQLQKLQISRVDVLNDADIEALAETHWDIIVSNPPYVSQRVWDYGHGQLGYSVRKYEPKLALVPGQGIAVPDGWQHQDVFYARLLDIAAMLRPTWPHTLGHMARRLRSGGIGLTALTTEALRHLTFCPTRASRGGCQSKEPDKFVVFSSKERYNELLVHVPLV